VLFPYPICLDRISQVSHQASSLSAGLLKSGLGKRALDEALELTQLQAALARHKTAQVIVDFSGVVRCPGNEVRHAADRLPEHVVMILVPVHAFIEQGLFDDSHRIRPRVRS
jgi:hypothetical protein